MIRFGEEGAGISPRFGAEHDNQPLGGFLELRGYFYHALHD
jgi:hypothetical protein